MNKGQALERVVEQIGLLMNSVDPSVEINKLIALELTLNHNAADMSYEEIMTEVIIKLTNFYKNDELEDLWTEYLMIDDELYDVA
jgi:hypothetical protein